jgi:hypothetical protein
MNEQGTRRGTSPAALAWLGGLLLLLAGSLALVVYAGWVKWRELASEPPARPPETAQSSPVPDARRLDARAKSKPEAAGVAGGGAAPAQATRAPARPADVKTAAPATGTHSAARPETDPARSARSGRGSLGAGPATAGASIRPRSEPKRIPAEEAQRRLAVLGAKLDHDHFQFAVARGELDQVRLFLEAGYSPNLKMAGAENSIFYLTLIGLHDPKQEEAAILMLDYGADLEVRAPSGITPLMMAAIHCKPRFAEALIGRGAQVKAQDPEGTTALVWAERASCAPVTALLAKRGAR